MAIPLILDTDIGTDVDDVWALVFLLNCPEVDVKLITTCTGDTEYRARLVAKILSELDREDIPIGIGLHLDRSENTHNQWLGNYSLEDFQGEVFRDGVGAICDTISAQSTSSTLLSIGPLPNVSGALSRAPEITKLSRFVGMHGSLRKGYLGMEKPAREYNVKLHALSCKHVFESDWNKTITPLDSCGDIYLDGDRFARLLNAQNPSARIVTSAHQSWLSAIRDWPMYKKASMENRSSILFDCVAVYLSFSEDWLKMEEHPILVTEDGKTMIDESGDMVNCATDWLDQEKFLDLLVDRLL
jgi:inosine-uridine nucleoside N-ribohydrolase